MVSVGHKLRIVVNPINKGPKNSSKSLAPAQCSLSLATI